MTFRLAVTVNDADVMRERTYDYEVEFPRDTPIEQIEAHLRNMIVMLDRQAYANSDDDDDDDAWQEGPGAL
jgi:hypothetical protein